VVELANPEIRVSEPAWSFTAEEKAEGQGIAQQGTGFVHMIRLEEICGDAEKPNEFHYEHVLQRFDDYVLRFEERWEKYEDDPDCGRKIADELGCTLLHDHGHEDELIEQEFSEGMIKASSPEGHAVRIANSKWTSRQTQSRKTSLRLSRRDLMMVARHRVPGLEFGRSEDRDHAP
jgi:hypothetical protein